MLSFLLLTFLAFTPSPSTALADQVNINAANTALSSALSSLSSLFTAKPSALIDAKPTFCCGDDCPPGACDINRIVPTDLGYVFPAPSINVPGTSASPLNLPCCHQGCPDGACRTTPTKASQRPLVTSPPRLFPSQNIIVGCCDSCHNCDQNLITHPVESLAGPATATEEAASSITASASLDDTVPKQEQFPHGPAGELLTDICAGCGTCYPCDFARIATWVEFSPHPTARQGESGATTTESAAASKSAATAANVARERGEEPEPTIYLAQEIVDSINGRNQDVLPIILQNGGTDSAIAGALGAGKKELRTVLANVDLKLSENYITRRLLKHLGRLGDVVPYPKALEAAVAVVSRDLDQVNINATVVVDLVAGAQDDDTRRLFRNVRFSVFGREDDDVVNADVGEVILGSKLLREMNAVTMFPGFKDQVQEGIKILEKVHYGNIGTPPQGANKGANGRHDEL